MKIPIRTCICCRGKFDKKLLNQMQCIDKKLEKFTGVGRSFYVCDDCINHIKKLEKALYRQCKNKDDYIGQLKEILANGR
ncbi:MAG: hypothetical protein U9Q33_00440 [Campylobacterota bacterium]|nr:hypothetical protein [Campylobacterota bacterium]